MKRSRRNPCPRGRRNPKDPHLRRRRIPPHPWPPEVGGFITIPAGAGFEMQDPIRFRRLQSPVDARVVAIEGDRIYFDVLEPLPGDSPYAGTQGWTSRSAIGPRRNPRRVVETPGARGGAMKVHGIVGDVVYEIRYRHGEDAEDYVHKFETPASLWALEGGGLLIESETHRLWDDF